MNRKVILVLLILVSILALSHVSASENVNDTQVIMESDETDGNAFQLIDENDAELSFDNNYRNIQQEIDDAQENSTIYLRRLCL